MKGRVVHWELAIAATAILLAGWLRAPGLAWAVAALVSGIVALVLAVRVRPLVALLAGATVLVGVGTALRTSARVGRVERVWADDTTGVRWQLVEAAGGRLDGDLAGAVTLARDLAAAGVAAIGLDRGQAFDRLDQVLRHRGPERGVVIFEGGRPWAWSGRHRLPALPVVGLEVRITPFYALLSAGRQGAAGRLVVAHVLLAADSVVPDRQDALDARFARATGVGLQIYPPGGGPFLADVFDYCVPSCGATDVVPDTLFSVRLAPPSQGAYRHVLLTRGTAWVAAATLALLMGLVAFGAGWMRAMGLVVLVGVLAGSPTGRSLPTGHVFSPAFYYDDLLGPLTASSGALLAVAGLVAMGGFALLHRAARVRAAAGGALLLVLVGPLLLRRLAEGITPPVEGADAVVWMTWQVALAVAGAALVLVAAAFARVGGVGTGGPRAAGLAVAGALTLAVTGLAVWTPTVGWPAWYLLAWIPVFALAALPASRAQTVALAAVVAGSIAVVLTWGAAAEGRILLAARDAAGLQEGGDAMAVRFLERFGAAAREQPAPRSSGDLYRSWRRTPLETDRYPAVLTVQDSAGATVARLGLAGLDLPEDLVAVTARAAADSQAAVVTPFTRGPGTHYVLAVPTGDSATVVVGLGPRTRLIPPVRVARFLRGERVLPPPYTLALGAGAPDGDVMVWRRVGRSAVGDARLTVDGAPSRLVADVPLGVASSLGLRGALAVLLDLLVVALLWAVAEHVGGRPVVYAVVRRARTRRSYRGRLAVAFAIFFVVPTVLFAGWIAVRLREESRRTRDVATRQILAEAAGEVRERDGALAPDSLARALSARLDADLLIYQGGELRATSVPVLADLGVLDWYLRGDVAARVAGPGQLDYATDQRIGGRLTRVGYQALGDGSGPALVLGAPRLLEDPALLRNEQDLVLGLILVTLGGLAAALLLAGLAARALATPVQRLQTAAEQVGRGEVPTPFGGDAPGEFAPVMEAFEQMARDVHAARAALEAQRQRTAAVLRNVATGVVALDETFRVVTSNPRAEELLGVILHAGDPLLERSPAAWQPVWTWVAEVGLDTAPGEPREFAIDDRQIRAQVAPLSGAASGWVVTLDDVSDLARVVRVLAWGELARQIAHEIKNPLTPIRLGVQHLRRAYEAPRGDFAETLDRTSRQILAEIERLDAIARAFSRFGAPPSGAEPLGPVDAMEVARDTAALYALGQEGGVSAAGVGPVTVLARRDELKEVLINLVENARSAGASTVQLEVRPFGEGAEIALRDDGRGIATDELPRIFEPRFSTTTSGAGLGLAICRRLVESWGGTIAVESEVGRGTVVRIGLAVPAV